MSFLDSKSRILESKIMSFEDVIFDLQATAGVETVGKHPVKLVATNGSFDILHAGHVKYLEQAKQLGGILLVLVNTDASVRRYKPAPQPYQELQHRMVCLAALESVDYVTCFDEDTPCDALIKLYDAGVGPHFHVKGADYKKEDMPETRIVEKHGGEIYLQQFTYQTSTSSLVQRIIMGHARALVESRQC